MEKVNNWIEEWLALWPKEIKSGGETIQSPSKWCVNKMQKLVDNNPVYTKQLIFAATQLYLKERERDNYFSVKRATYFIDKLGQGSTLQTYCEQLLKEREPTLENEIPEYNPINDFI